MITAKIIGLFIGAIAGLAQASMTISKPMNDHKATTSRIVDELYSDHLYEKNIAMEVPTSFASNEGSSLTIAEAQAAPSIESVADLASTTTKKKGKRSKSSASF
jgi:hypothetical protein